MRSFVPWLLVLTLTLGAGSALGGAIDSTFDSDPISELRDDAMAHYRAGEHDLFVAQMETVAAHSADGTDEYNLACGYALTGRLDEALGTLSRVVDRGGSFDLGEDPDLRSLRTRPEFYRLLARSAFHAEADRRLEPVRDLAMERFYETEQYGPFVEVMENVARYSNSDLDLYNLACGYALNGQGDEAIATLERLAERGTDFGAAGDSDFDNLRSDPRFHAILARLSG